MQSYIQIPNLKDLRREADLTQDALADLAGVSRSTISRTERNGHVTPNTAGRIMRSLSRALKRSLDFKAVIENGGSRDF